MKKLRSFFLRVKTWSRSSRIINFRGTKKLIGHRTPMLVTIPTFLIYSWPLFLSFILLLKLWLYLFIIKTIWCWKSFPMTDQRVLELKTSYGRWGAKNQNKKVRLNFALMAPNITRNIILQHQYWTYILKLSCLDSATISDT